MVTIPAHGGGEQEPVIVIGVKIDKLEFNSTEISVEKGVTYTVIFVNEDVGSFHNFIIDEDGDAAEDNMDESPPDLLIGPVNNDISSGTQGAPGRSWSKIWTTPSEDKLVVYYCGYIGHWRPGMWGKFKVGTLLYRSLKPFPS